jgi:hypothetical protein
MKPFRALVDIRPVLPDDRLYTVEITESAIINVFREGFFNEEARWDMEEYMRHITRYEQWMKDDNGSPHFTGGTHRFEGWTPDGEGELDIHMDAVSDRVLGLQTCAPLVRPGVFIWLVQRRLVAPEVVPEFDQAVSDLHPQFNRWKKPGTGLESLYLPQEPI